jgi:hypothetical protein
MMGQKRVLPATPWLAQFANEIYFSWNERPKKMSRKVGASRRHETLSSIPFLFVNAKSGWSTCAVTVPLAFVEPLGPSTPAKNGIVALYHATIS